MKPHEKLARADARGLPSKALIDTIRARFPTEKEVDRVLTHKMATRGGPGYVAPTLDALAAGAKKLIERSLGHGVEVCEARWLPGGASNLQMAFDLHWRGGGGPAVTKLVLRMGPSGSLTESSRRREFQILKAVAGAVPAPTAYWVDADAEFLPHPAIIYGFVRGVVRPSRPARGAAGLGQNYGPELRERLAPQFVGLLARLHNVDVDGLTGIDAFERPRAGSNASVIKQVNACRRAWEEDRLEAIPFVDVVYKWLVKNAPPLDRVSIVHGDYRSGNFLFDEESGEITAWLDWEGAALGDRHQDLTYATHYTFQHLAEDGATQLASGMLPAGELFEAYGRASGLSVDPRRVEYYGVFNRFLIAVLSLGAAARASHGGKSHHDVLLNYIAGIGYPALEDLRTYFEKVAA